MEVDPNAEEARRVKGDLEGAKARNLGFMLRSEGNWLSISENAKDQIDVGTGEITSHVSKSTTLSDGFQSAIKRCSVSSPVGAFAVLNMDHDITQSLQHKDSNSKVAQDVHASRLDEKRDNDSEPKSYATPVLGFDLNVVDSSQMADYNPFQPYKKLDQVIPIDASECGSTTFPLEENASLKRWKAMKQNGFLSLNHGGIPLPKQRSRQPKKRKEDALKKKIEIARREQAKKVANVVGPSGLLSGLNPGIINHVRNRKQVLSIIAAVVKSETLERQKNDKLNEEDGQRDCRTRDLNKKHESIASRPLLFLQKPNFSSRHVSQFETSGTIKDDEVLAQDNDDSVFYAPEQSDDLTLKQSAMCGLSSKGASQISYDDNLASKENIAFLSVKGANVASQWLELLRQDIKGRLAALRRSRKRVRNAIQTELPSLLSRGNMFSQENSTCKVQSTDIDATPEMHLIRWKVLFSRMDKELSEEGKHLEAWLEQVTEMLAQCEVSLSSVNLDCIASVGSSDNTSGFQRTGAFDAESAVRAAAASIYSTCTLAMSKENVPCY